MDISAVPDTHGLVQAVLCAAFHVDEHKASVMMRARENYWGWCLYILCEETMIRSWCVQGVDDPRWSHVTFGMGMGTVQHQGDLQQLRVALCGCSGQ